MNNGSKKTTGETDEMGMNTDYWWCNTCDEYAGDLVKHSKMRSHKINVKREERKKKEEKR